MADEPSGTVEGSAFDSLAAQQADLVDQICDRFEADWRAGRRPVIEDDLAIADNALQSALFRELLSVEIEQRSRLGESPEPAEYLRRFPAHAGAVRALLGVEAALVAPNDSRYHILREHARGGLGEVFVADDAELHREVALKEIRPEFADDPQRRARFVMEAEITGRLEHPGVVPVYGLGFYRDGRPYYAMRLVKGDSLKEAIRKHHDAESVRLDPSERALALRGLLRRFIDVCNTVAYAHSRGVLHRDLKPGNIMLGPYGETLVVDWGLAKVVGRSEKHTPTAFAAEGTLRPSAGEALTPTLQGAAHGTPAYMSPEQAGGHPDEVGPASDVYSLGAVLYTLLTGRGPFDDADVEAALWRVIRGDFPQPRTVNPAVDLALEAVCLRAMALRPEDRFASPRRPRL